MTEQLLGRPFQLENLVAYQEGTISSRMIVNKPSGTITLFAFEKGEGLSEHTAPFDAMVTILDGECEFALSGTPHHLHAGQTLIFPAGAPHALTALTRFKMMLVMIRG